MKTKWLLLGLGAVGLVAAAFLLKQPAPPPNGEGEAPEAKIIIIIT